MLKTYVKCFIVDWIIKKSYFYFLLNSRKKEQSVEKKTNIMKAWIMLNSEHIRAILCV